MEITTARVLDKRRILKKTETYPLSIRVTANRKSVLFPIGLSLSAKDFEKLSSPRLGEKLAKIRDHFGGEEARAKKIIESMGTFTFPAFREAFYKNSSAPRKRKRRKTIVEASAVSPPASPGTEIMTPTGLTKKYGTGKFDKIRSKINFEPLGPLAVAFGEYIKVLEAQDRIGTSEAYFFSLMNLLKFRKMLRFEDITVQFLYEFEKWMLSRNKSYTSIGIYIRNLRAIINLPKNKKLFSEENYPFGRGKYLVPTGTNIKKALDLTDIKKIYDYRAQTNEKNEMFARDMWLFGYFSNGINPKDIACLKYENITEEDFIIIQREKTRFTTRANPKKITIPINDDMRRIMDQWGTVNRDPTDYIFPILTKGICAHRKRELIHGFNRLINEWMKIIGSSLGIKKKIRTMEYRHSMATVLKRSEDS